MKEVIPVSRPSPPTNSILSGASYFVEGVKLIWHPSLRIYILVPLLVNCVLFVLLTSAMFTYLSETIDGFMSDLPSWLAPLTWIAWIVIGVLLLIVYGYSFNMITNVLAAPFYGLLAEKAEEIMTGHPLPPEPLIQMIPRVFSREISKLIYFLLRGILVTLVIVLIATIPLIGMLAPVIGLAWGAWSMTVQYSDYPADNHQKSFKILRKKLWKKMFSSFGFGGMVMACSVVPVINIFAMPAAVVGGTIFWLNELKKCEPEPVDHG